MPALPFKLNQDHRHHIPRQQHKVTNWPAYEAGLRQRGSLTVWFTDEAVAAWAAEPRMTRGGQPFYSPLAILTALTLRALFRLAYRQAEGLIGSIISLLGLMPRVPDHTTLSRRSATLSVPQPQPDNTDAGNDAQALHLMVDSTGLPNSIGQRHEQGGLARCCRVGWKEPSGIARGGLRPTRRHRVLDGGRTDQAAHCRRRGARGGQGRPARLV
jgi:hypothetical protein